MFFKPRENIKAQALVTDARKLAVKLHEHPNAKAYILIAGRKRKLQEAGLPAFVSQHMSGDRAYWPIDKSANVSLRPSRKQIPAGDSFVMTWEVMTKA